MTSVAMAAGTLSGAAVRRTRKTDGHLFAIFWIKDSDRGEDRRWKVFANDAELIERVEALRVGDPIAVAGPFAVEAVGDRAQLENRITAWAILDTKRPKKSKSKTQKRIEERVTSEEQGPPDDGGPIDEIGF